MTGPRILVVDDNPINLELACYTLESDGFTVDWASGAGHALERMRTFKPELILMDIQMPDIDGLEATRRIRANPESRDVVIVALTAYAMKGDEAKMLAAGCDGYLPKPIDVTSLGRSVTEFLRVHRRTVA